MRNILMQSAISSLGGAVLFFLTFMAMNITFEKIHVLIFTITVFVLTTLLLTLLDRKNKK